MRVMIVSDSVAHKTGYGVQTKLLAEAMAADGHRVFNYAPGAAHAGKYDVAFADGKPTITVLTSNFGDDRWGNSSLDFHINAYQPDLIITWLDCQGLAAYGFSQVPTFMWAPIDTWPVPEREQAILNRAEKILVCSKWGQEVLAEHDIHAEYVPCGVDMRVYDIDAAEGKKWRGQLKPVVEDGTFLIGMVGLNTGAPDRKGYPYAFEAIKAFIDLHPDDDIRAFIQTNPSPSGGGMDLFGLRRELGLESKMYFGRDNGPNFEPETAMRGMYNAFDVLLHTAMTEGFGVPVVEAQACGTPVVVNAATSVTELSSAGYKSKPSGHVWIQTVTKIAVPHVEGLVQMLEAAYADWKAGEIDAETIRASVDRYDFAEVYDRYWRPILVDVPAPKDYGAGERKLMLAAGMTRKEGFTHHDRRADEGIDVVHDLNEFPYPFEDDSYDYVEFIDCIEHLKADLPLVMDELWRMIDAEGYLFIHTAEVGSWQLFLDPTHVRGFDLHSFDYFDPKTSWGGHSPYDYTDKKWKIVHKTTDNYGGLVFVMQPRKIAVETNGHKADLVGVPA